MPFQPPPGAQPPPPAFPPAGPPVHQTTLPPPPGWAPPAAWGPPPVTAGSLLNRTLQVWWQNVGALVALELATLVPLVLAIVAGVAVIGAAFAGLVPKGGPEASPALFGIFSLIFLAVLVLVLPVTMLMLGGVNYGVIQWLAGRPAGVGDMLRQGARRTWGLFLASLLVGLAVMGGSLLLIVPGIMVAVATILALPATTVEGGGAVQAFRRSLELTRGYRWSIFAAFLALMALNLVIGIGGALLGIIPILGFIMNLVLSLVTATIPYVLPAVAYHDLRVLKEGVDTTQLSRVFE